LAAILGVGERSRTAQDQELASLVAFDRIGRVEQYLEQNTRNVEHRTEALIARAKQRLTQFRAGTLPAKVQAEWATGHDLTGGLTYSATQPCPACGDNGVLEGDDGSNVEIQYQVNLEDPESPEVYAIVHVPADFFSCGTCHLVLDRYELIAQAGLPEVFDVIDDERLEGPGYGND
jgi:hypothetical protein